MTRELPRYGSSQIIVHDLAETERDIGDDMGSRDDFQHRQFGERGERVRKQGQSRRPVQAPLSAMSWSRYSTSSQMRAVPSTCGMILSRKFGANSDALIACSSATLCL